MKMEYKYIISEKKKKYFKKENWKELKENI